MNRNRSAGRPMMPLTGVELGISVCAHGRAPQLQMCAGPLYGSNRPIGPLTLVPGIDLKKTNLPLQYTKTCNGTNATSKWEHN